MADTGEYEQGLLRREGRKPQIVGSRPRLSPSASIRVALVVNTEDPLVRQCKDDHGVKMLRKAGTAPKIHKFVVVEL